MFVCLYQTKAAVIVLKTWRNSKHTAADNNEEIWLNTEARLGSSLSDSYKQQHNSRRIECIHISPVKNPK